jgi:hypothetical protein
MSIGVLQPNGVHLGFWNVSSATVLNVVAQRPGNHEVYVYNESSFPITIAVGSWFAYLPIRHPQLRIVVCRNVLYTTTEIRMLYRSAVNAFVPQFGIVFPDSPSVSRSTQMRGHECSPNNLSRICRTNNCHSSCGTVCSTASSSHNRGALRLLHQDVHTNPQMFTLRVVAHDICGDNNGHRAVNGAARRETRDSVVTLYSDNVVRTAQHELTHNLGVVGHCTGTCVMNEVRSPGYTDVWCVPCALIIRVNLGSLPNTP